MQKEEIKRNVKELNNFINKFPPKIEKKFNQFDDKLCIKYHTYKRKIDQLSLKKTYYIKNLEKIENVFKIKNNFIKLKNELEFFRKYSITIDGRISELNSKIDKEKISIIKKQELVSKYREIIKILCKKNIQNYKYSSLLKELKKIDNIDKEKKKILKKPKMSFFLTENIKLNKKNQKQIFLRKQKFDFFIYFNLFKESMNKYFQYYFKLQLNSKKKGFFSSYLFELFKSIKESSLKKKSLNSINLMELAELKFNSFSIPIGDKISDFDEISILLFQIENPKKKYNGFNIYDFDTFMNLTENQIFGLILYKLDIVKILNYEWKEILKLNLKILEKKKLINSTK